MPNALLDTTPEYLEEAFHFNVSTAHALTRAAVPHLLTRPDPGGEHRQHLLGHGPGHRAAATSPTARPRRRWRTTPGSPPATSPRASGSTRSRSARWRPPRSSSSPSDDETKAAMEDATPLRRIGDPEDIAADGALPGLARPAATSPARCSRSTAASTSPTSTSACPTWTPEELMSTSAAGRRLVHRQRRAARHRRHRRPARPRAGRRLGVQPRQGRQGRRPARRPRPRPRRARHDDGDALLALKPDCIVHTAMADDRLFEAIDDLVSFLEAGINVVSSRTGVPAVPARRPPRRHGRADPARPARRAAPRCTSTASTPASPTTCCRW